MFLPSAQSLMRWYQARWPQDLVLTFAILFSGRPNLLQPLSLFRSGLPKLIDWKNVCLSALQWQQIQVMEHVILNLIQAREELILMNALFRDLNGN